mgnify:CR=1 FL=1
MYLWRDTPAGNVCLVSGPSVEGTIYELHEHTGGKHGSVYFPGSKGKPALSDAKNKRTNPQARVGKVRTDKKTGKDYVLWRPVLEDGSRPRIYLDASPKNMDAELVDVIEAKEQLKSSKKIIERKEKEARSKGLRGIWKSGTGRKIFSTPSKPKQMLRSSSATPLFDSEGDEYRATYAVIATQDNGTGPVMASNLPESFVETSEYPRVFQARSLQRMGEKQKIRKIAKSLDADRLLLPHSDATLGAPVVWEGDGKTHKVGQSVVSTPKGSFYVLGGNGRTIALLMAPTKRYQSYVQRAKALWPDVWPAGGSPDGTRNILVRVATNADGSALTFSQARTLAGRTQKSASGEESPIGKAISLIRSLGIESVSDLPRFMWKGIVTQDNVEEFVAENPAYANAVFRSMGAARAESYQQDAGLLADLFNDLMVGYLPRRFQVEGFVSEKQERALLAALPILLSIQAGVQDQAVQAKWDLFALLNPALRFAQEIKNKSDKQAVAMVERAARQVQIGEGTAQAKKFQGLFDELPILAVLFGIVLKKAEKSRDPAITVEKYLTPYAEEAFASPSARSVGMFGGGAPDPGKDPAMVLGAELNIQLPTRIRETEVPQTQMIANPKLPEPGDRVAYSQWYEQGGMLEHPKGFGGWQRTMGTVEQVRKKIRPKIGEENRIEVQVTSDFDGRKRWMDRGQISSIRPTIQSRMFNPATSRIPPATVAREAKKALQIRSQLSKNKRAGTAVGLSRANQLAARRPVSQNTLKRMVSFFARHDGKVERAARKRDSKSKAAQDWGLWGGDPGRQWAKKELKTFDSPRKNRKGQLRVGRAASRILERLYLRGTTGYAANKDGKFPAGIDELVNKGLALQETCIPGSETLYGTDTCTLKLTKRGQEFAKNRRRAERTHAAARQGRMFNPPQLSLTGIYESQISEAGSLILDTLRRTGPSLFSADEDGNFAPGVQEVLQKGMADQLKFERAEDTLFRRDALTIDLNSRGRRFIRDRKGAAGQELDKAQQRLFNPSKRHYLTSPQYSQPYPVPPIPPSGTWTPGSGYASDRAQWHQEYGDCGDLTEVGDQLNVGHPSGVRCIRDSPSYQWSRNLIDLSDSKSGLASYRPMVEGQDYFFRPDAGRITGARKKQGRRFYTVPGFDWDRFGFTGKGAFERAVAFARSVQWSHRSGPAYVDWYIVGIENQDGSGYAVMPDVPSKPEVENHFLLMDKTHPEQIAAISIESVDAPVAAQRRMFNPFGPVKGSPKGRGSWTKGRPPGTFSSWQEYDQWKLKSLNHAITKTKMLIEDIGPERADIPGGANAQLQDYLKKRIELIALIDESTEKKKIRRTNSSTQLRLGLLGSIPVLHFASGSNHPGEIRGFADFGKAVGAAISGTSKRKSGGSMRWYRLCRQDCIDELVRATQKGIPVFLDSGAFSEVAPTDTPGVFRVVAPITPSMWKERLSVYQELAEKAGPMANVVAPDMVGFQEQSFQRLKKYAPEVRELIRTGANVLVPLQKGSLSLAEAYKKAAQILGSEDWVPALPFKMAATTPAELELFLAEIKPRRVHLLGVGPRTSKAKSNALANAIRRGSPGTQVQMDSVAITAHSAREKGKPPRRVTAAQDVARERLRQERYQGYEIAARPDYTDLVSSPSEWASPASLGRLAKAGKLTKSEKVQLLNDPDEFFQSIPKGQEDPFYLTMEPQIESEFAKAAHKFETYETKRAGVREGLRELYEQPSFLRNKKSSLFERVGSFGAPVEGEKGFRQPTQKANSFGGESTFNLADRLLGNALYMMDEPEMYWAYCAEVPQDCEGQAAMDEYDAIESLADLLDVPKVGGSGENLDEQERTQIALAVTKVAMETDENRWVGMEVPIGVFKSRKGSSVVKFAPRSASGNGKTADYGAVPKWAGRVVLTDWFASMVPGKPVLRIVNVDKRTAARFIETHHSALPYLNPRGLLFALGLMKGDRLVAVATANTPSGRWDQEPRVQRGELDPQNIVELSRVASDGTTKGASSKLVSRIIDVMDRAKRGDPDAPSLLVTYQLATESGATYKGLQEKGLRPVSYREGGEPSGARAGGKQGEDAALARADKIRWECCDTPPALRGDWSLVREKQRTLFNPLGSIWNPSKQSAIRVNKNTDAPMEPITFMFDGGKFSAATASKWMKHRGIATQSAPKARKLILIDSMDRSKIRRHTLRRIIVDEGVSAIVGVPRSE